jgi:methyl-accepting chemotaxis protein
MSSSIRDIAAKVAQSSAVANSAAEEAANTETDVRELQVAASKIGEVVDLINNIAGQTNLLALNATIEAARAGESGRGFAVVASEVKQLASQTAKATEEIAAKIAEIRSATDRTVGSIDKIVATVSQIREISNEISSAIAEQGTATNEIALATQRAADGTSEVTTIILDVGQSAKKTGETSDLLLDLSNGLTRTAEALKLEVTGFVETIQAA